MPIATGSPTTAISALRDPSRRGASSLFLSLGLVAVSSFIFAVLAALNPLLSTSAITVLSLSLVFSIASAVVFLQPNPDALNPLRMASVVWILIYCIGPLMTKDFDWFFVANKTSLLEKASLAVLGAYIAFCIGYLVGPSARRRERRRVESAYQAPLVFAGLALIAVGFIAYTAAFLFAGGVERIIGGEESRVEFFKGFGWLYWASFFMLPGAALYFTALAPRKPIVALLHAWPFLLFFVSFILLQGRFRALRAVICFLVLWHYRVRRIRTTRLALFAIVGFVLFVFVGYARTPEVRPYLLSDPILVVRTVADNFLEFSQTVVGDGVSRLQQVMLAIDAFPSRLPYDWGASLLNWANPILRFLGLPELQFPEMGTIFLRLALPDLPDWIESAFHTSLVGQLLANFPWFFMPFGMVLYGAFVRYLYSRLIQEDRSFIALAAYAVLLFPMVSMLIVGPVLMIFELIVVIVPILVARLLLREVSARSAEALPQASYAGEYPR